MKLKLYERRTKTRLICSNVTDEDQCCLCFSHNTVNQLEPLKPNIHGLTDGRGNTMLEHNVSCMTCGANWVDVFCRIYPEDAESQDEQGGWNVTL